MNFQSVLTIYLHWKTLHQGTYIFFADVQVPAITNYILFAICCRRQVCGFLIGTFGSCSIPIYHSGRTTRNILIFGVIFTPNNWIKQEKNRVEEVGDRVDSGWWVTSVLKSYRLLWVWVAWRGKMWGEKDLGSIDGDIFWFWGRTNGEE